MHPLQKQFHDEIKEKQLFPREGKVLLAVSGGVDSMVMAHLFLLSENSFEIAHCNFALRGEDSDKDEQLVRNWAKNHNVVCHVKRFDLEGSIQLAAREARYKWFSELTVKFGHAAIATAHHINDSLETALFNLSRGTGIRGLSGVPSKSNDVVRPMLFTSKDQLLTYAKEHDIEWREDASNRKTDYGRNLIRNRVIPTLKELNPSLEETFANTLERLQLTNQLLAEYVDVIKNDFLRQEDEVWKLDVSWIKKSTDSLILSEVVSEFGFNYVTSKEIFETLNKPGKVFMSASFELSIDRSTIYIKSKNRFEEDEVVIASEGLFTVGSRSIKISITERRDVSFDSNKNVVFIDTSKIGFPMKFRTWKEGDRFRPLGMKGQKKISDYLIDNKVPLAHKESVKVVTYDGAIIWLVGHQISDDCKIVDETPSVLKMEWL
ncbi:MAG: tRNA lysidine(34) synthetase TilS [Ekhidna sp.]